MSLFAISEDASQKICRFQISKFYEDGVRQEINFSRFVSSIGAGSQREQSGLNNQKNRTNVPPLRENTTDNGKVPGVTAVAFVFDRLTPEGRARATQAALSYLQETGNSDELFARKTTCRIV
jgi:hypothetical protein